MSQPLVRTALTHDPASMAGQAYLPEILFFEVNINSSGSGIFWSAPPDTWIVEVEAQIETALDGSGTVDIGVDGNTDLFIANSEWTETSLDQYIASSKTTAPGGVFLPAGDNLAVEVGGSPTVGKVRIAVWVLNFASMALQGVHNTVQI